jgi:ribosomal protein S18 acetylase RimI-like enzyme
MYIVVGETRHVDPVWDLMARCKHALEAQAIFQWDELYPTRELIETDVHRGVLFVLEDDDGHCLASVVLDDRQAEEYTSLAWMGQEPALVVHRLCVDPAAQGRGHAHRLMEFAELHAARSGYASIRLDAYTGNPRSVALYRRRGYRTVGQIHFPRRELPFWCFELMLDAATRGSP